LRGNHYIQSIFFPSGIRKSKNTSPRTSPSYSQIRQVNILGPPWWDINNINAFGFHPHDNDNDDNVMEYLLTLFAKHLLLYQVGGDLEQLLEKMEPQERHQQLDGGILQEQQENKKKKKELLLTLADWNLSGSRHYARQIVASSSCSKPISPALLPLVLERLSRRPGSETTIATHRQANVLNKTLQEIVPLLFY
jgi:hypothetical protein